MSEIDAFDIVAFIVFGVTFAAVIAVVVVFGRAARQDRGQDKFP